MSQPEDTYDDDALAAEYVLHLLSAADRAAFEARINAEPALHRLVQAWEARLVPLAAELPEVQPPDRLRGQLLAALEPERTPPRRTPLLWLLGGLAVAMVVVALVFGGGLRPELDLTPAFGTELASGEGDLVLSVAVIPATHELVIERLVGAMPEGRVHELWLIAEGADAPISLGLLDRGGSTRIRVPDEIAPGVRSGTIALSLEPLGGAPDGVPTGPILAMAQFSDF